MTEFELAVEAAMFDALDPPQNQGELWMVSDLAPRVAAAIEAAALVAENYGSGMREGAVEKRAIRAALAALRGSGETPQP